MFLFPHIYSPWTFLLFLCCHHHYHKDRQEDIITISFNPSPSLTQDMEWHQEPSLPRLLSVDFPTLIQLLCRSFFVSIHFIYCGQPAWQCSVIEQGKKSNEDKSAHPIAIHLVCTITKNEKHHQRLEYRRHNGFYWVLQDIAKKELVVRHPHFCKRLMTGIHFSTNSINFAERMIIEWYTDVISFHHHLSDIIVWLWLCFFIFQFLFLYSFNFLCKRSSFQSLTTKVM